MDNFPLVSILIVHYNRPDALEKGFQALKNNINYPALEIVVTDDCSQPEVIERIKQIPFDNIVFADRNMGIGANANKGIRACRGEYILQIQDDHILMEGFNDFLHKGIKVLKSESRIGFVRFIVGRNFRVKETRHLDNTEFYIVPKAVFKNGERGFYQYSDLPHLKPRNIHDRLGYYLEGKPMAYTENEFNIRFLKSKNISIAYIKDYENIFDTYEAPSYRSTELSKRSRKTFKNFLKNFFKKKVPLVKMARFYYWLWKYDYNKRQL